MKVLIALLLIVTAKSQAEEPGYYKIDSKTYRLPGQATANLRQIFAGARGLHRYEFETLHYNRVACGRRLFTATGESLEGDGDLKATLIPPGFLEIEFPTYLSLGAFGSENPFHNEVGEIETVHGRTLLQLRDWRDGTALSISKQSRLQFISNKPSETVKSRVEVRVLDGTYPSTYLVREVVETQPKMEIYLVCQ
ncbi:MAG: hypothetical protein AB7F86_06635 [Bdellovibrionales bacterium]